MGQTNSNGDVKKSNLGELMSGNQIDEEKTLSFLRQVGASWKGAIGAIAGLISICSAKLEGTFDFEHPISKASQKVREDFKNVYTPKAESASNIVVPFSPINAGDKSFGEQCKSKGTPYLKARAWALGSLSKCRNNCTTR
jgi:hypothetical protein